MAACEREALLDGEAQETRLAEGGGRQGGAVRAHRVGGAGDGDADVGALERGRVVDAVAGHADRVAQLAQRLHDQVLVLRVHLRGPWAGA